LGTITEMENAGSERLKLFTLLAVSGAPATRDAEADVSWWTCADT
jgi:hypothetical protein